MRESAIEKKLRLGIKALGGRAYKWVSPGRAGVPDRIVFLPGGGVKLVELKSENGRMSGQQNHVAFQLIELGQKIYVLNSVAKVESFLTHCRAEICCGGKPNEI